MYDVLCCFVMDDVESACVRVILCFKWRVENAIMLDVC